MHFTIKDQKSNYGISLEQKTKKILQNYKIFCEQSTIEYNGVTMDLQIKSFIEPA